MQHNFDTIKRKIQRGGAVLPAEVVLCLKEILMTLSGLEERLDGLEASTKSRQRSGSVPKRKVSESEVQSRVNK